MKLTQIIEATREAIGTNAKVLKYELEKLGWRRRLRWVYQQGEEIDGRQTIIERFVIFMTALKRTDYKSFEYLKFEIDWHFDSVEIVGVPKEENPVGALLEQIETAVTKIKAAVEKV